MILDIIYPRVAHIGENNTVKRILPFRTKRSLGPFCFLDHMGPVAMADNSSADVLSHPHIGLETVTYLFEGQLFHRDSLGTRQIIQSGDVNWMTAGKGIAHSERSVYSKESSRLHGLQAWIALPKQHEDCDPRFVHYSADVLPVFDDEGTEAKIIVGHFLNYRSPVKTYFETIYVYVKMLKSACFSFFNQYEELGLYLIDGEIKIDNKVFNESALIVLQPQIEIKIEANTNARYVIIGGQKLPEPRFMFWNFVSTDKSKIEKAKNDWKSGYFAKVIDETTTVPLPEE